MISTKGRYALRVMIDLAEHETDGLIPLKDISERQDISKKYLEIIVRDLVRSGLIEGFSGKGGGYRLCRKPKDYSLGEILENTEGSLAVVACLAPNACPCPREKECRTLPLWKEYDQLTHDFFYRKKLSEYMSKGKASKH